MGWMIFFRQNELQVFEANILLLALDFSQYGRL